MRAFVTGGHGFVGRFLCAHLAEAGDEVVAPDAAELDVTDSDAVRAVVSEVVPDAVYHLAGIASVAESWRAPEHVFHVNAGGTLAVLDAVRGLSPAPRVLLVSSAEVYGRVGPEALPIGEDAPLEPVTPYAASKAAAELVGVQSFHGWGVPVVRARPFNHIGPGQSAEFAVPAFARRIVEAAGAGAVTLAVGNLSARRDFTDVRDVVRAYRLLVLSGEAGEAYNVCSGRDILLEDVVRRLLVASGTDLALEVDPDLLRPVDIPVLRGDPSKLEAATGWTPTVPLDRTLADVLDDVRETARPPAGGTGGGPGVTVAD